MQHNYPPPPAALLASDDMLLPPGEISHDFDCSRSSADCLLLTTLPFSDSTSEDSRNCCCCCCCLLRRRERATEALSKTALVFLFFSFTAWSAIFFFATNKLSRSSFDRLKSYKQRLPYQHGDDAAKIKICLFILQSVRWMTQHRRNEKT